MKTGVFSQLGRAASLLNRKERLSFVVFFILRSSLAGLDVAGMALVGATTAMLTGAKNYQNFLPDSLEGLFSGISPSSTMLILTCSAVVLFTLKSLSSFFLNRTISLYLAKLESEKATQILERLNSGGIEQVEKYSISELNYALGTSIKSGISGIFGSTAAIVVELVMILSISIYLFATNAKLFIALFVFLAILVVLINLSAGNRAAKYAHAANLESMKASNSLYDIISNFRQLVTSGGVKTMTDRYRQLRIDSARASVLFEILGSAQRYIVEIVLIAGLALALLLNQMSPIAVLSAEVIAVFLAGSFRILGSIIPIQTQLNSYQQAKTNFRIVFDIYTETKMTKELVGQNSEETANIQGVVFKDVSYRYGIAKNPVLRAVNLELTRPGIYAITGKSGAGKSTFADLILGLRKPESGVVLVDGFSPEWRRVHTPGYMAYVPQRISLVTGTFAENISLFSQDDVDLKRLTLALKHSGLDEYVKNLPHGLETKLMDGQIRMSGGQLQRVGFARALYSNANLIVLDEATNSLDSKLEAEVLQTLKRMASRSIVILITHSKANLKFADFTIAINNGKLSPIKKVNPSDYQ